VRGVDRFGIGKLNLMLSRSSFESGGLFHQVCPSGIFHSGGCRGRTPTGLKNSDALIIRDETTLGTRVGPLIVDRTAILFPRLNGGSANTYLRSRLNVRKNSQAIGLNSTPIQVENTGFRRGRFDQVSAADHGRRT